MKRLFILRHAKSDWSADYGEDHERPLNKRGLRDAERMGRVIARLGVVPDAVLSSTAVRARTTVELAAAAGGWEREIALTSRLYDASVDAVIGEIRQTDDRIESLLIAGHEPTWSTLAGALVGPGSSGAELRFPTAALANVALGVESWSEVAIGLGRLDWLINPKLVAALGVE